MTLSSSNMNKRHFSWHENSQSFQQICHTPKLNSKKIDVNKSSFVNKILPNCVLLFKFCKLFSGVAPKETTNSTIKWLVHYSCFSFQFKKFGHFLFWKWHNFVKAIPSLFRWLFSFFCDRRLAEQGSFNLDMDRRPFSQSLKIETNFRIEFGRK